MKIANKMITVILGIVIAGLMLGFVFPTGLNAINEDPSYTVNSSVSEQISVDTKINATITDATSGTSATVQLTDTETGDTESKVINVGENATYTTLPGGEVSATVNSATATSAEVTYQPDKDYGWSDGSKSIYSVLGIFFVIVPLVVLAKMAMKA